MPFKKLNPQLQETIKLIGFEDPTSFQKQVLSKIKSGMNLFGIGPESCGKTTAMIISTIQKLNGRAFEDVPRALIFVKDKEAALNLEIQFREFTSNTDLRIISAYEDYNIDKQKDAIYYGVDIVIATPKWLSKLYFLNAISLGQLKLLIVEDAEFLVKNDKYTEVSRITESLSKCQYLIFAKTFEPRFEKLQNLFMSNSQVVEVLD